VNSPLTLTVGDGPGQTGPDRAEALIREAGPGATVRILDDGLDPTLVAAWLSGRIPADRGVRYLVDAPTTGNAPYNLARRVQSVARITGGRTDLVLHAGDGDEVSDPVTPDADVRDTGGDPDSRRAEYAEILTGLWSTFPRSALVGDQDNEVLADDSLIRPLNHSGRHYRVAGPLDGPAPEQGAPRILAPGEVA
jgi:alkanesulfonate monooxygenase SsuD/methylene tetrahydromethanopterin reductase-like flavin-dependent oxidoreductase (luciferase family)